MKGIQNSLLKLFLLVLLLSVFCGCGGTYVKPTGGIGDTSPAILLEQDASAEAQLVKLGNASLKNGEYSIAQYHYLEYLKNYGGGNYAPLAAIGVANALLMQGKPQDLLKQDSYLRGFIRTKPQAFTYNSLLAEAYQKTGARYNAINAMYGALNMATTPEEVAAGEAKLESILSLLTQEEVNSVSDGRNLQGVPQNDVMFRLGKALIIGGGNYALGAQILQSFMQKYPTDRNVPQAEALLSSGKTISTSGSCVVGCLLPLSGKFERFGNRALRGVELAVERFQMLNPGVRVQLVIKDTGGVREQTVAAIQELSRQGASAIIGPFDEVEIAAQTAQSLGIPIVVMSQREGVEKIGDFVFKNFLSPQMQVHALVNYCMTELGISTFAILYPQENFGTVYADFFRQVVETNGGYVSATASYDPSTRADFSGPINSLRQEGSFQALFFPEGEKKTAIILPQLFYYNIDKNVRMLGTNLWHDENLLRSTADYLRTSIIASGFAAEGGNPNAVWFASQYEGLYNETPTFIDAISFDTSYLVIKAAAMQGNTFNRAAVRNSIMYMQLPETITGFSGFNSFGEAQRTLNLLTVKKGQFVYIGAGR